MRRAAQSADFGLLSDALNLAQTGRYRTLAEIEKKIGGLPTLSKRERAVFDGLCDRARKELIRKSRA
jgi:hypothetical protein